MAQKAQRSKDNGLAVGGATGEFIINLKAAKQIRLTIPLECAGAGGWQKTGATMPGLNRILSHPWSRRTKE
jgi:hypothetical protein